MRKPGQLIADLVTVLTVRPWQTDWELAQALNVARRTIANTLRRLRQSRQVRRRVGARKFNAFEYALAGERRP